MRPKSSNRALLDLKVPSFFAFSTTGRSVSATKAPQAELVSFAGSASRISPLTPPLPFTLYLTVTLSSPFGREHVDSSVPWLRQTPILNVQELLTVESPSKSHLGSQSMHSTICFFPSTVTSLRSMPL